MAQIAICTFRDMGWLPVLTTADDDWLPSLRGAKRRSNPSIPELIGGLLRFARNDGRESLPDYFFTLLASILIDVSSILTENALSTSNGFSMPR